MSRLTLTITKIIQNQTCTLLALLKKWHPSAHLSHQRKPLLTYYTSQPVPLPASTHAKVFEEGFSLIISDFSHFHRYRELSEVYFINQTLASLPILLFTPSLSLVRLISDKHFFFSKLL